MPWSKTQLLLVRTEHWHEILAFAQSRKWTGVENQLIHYIPEAQACFKTNITIISNTSCQPSVRLVPVPLTRRLWRSRRGGRQFGRRQFPPVQRGRRRPGRLLERVNLPRGAAKKGRGAQLGTHRRFGNIELALNFSLHYLHDGWKD